MTQIKSDDHNLFEYLADFKVAKARHIHRDVYPHLAIFTVYKRLRRLAHAGHLDRQAYYWGSLITVFSLTKKAFRQFIETGFEKQVELSSGKVQHDLELVDLAAHFKASPQVHHYFHENSLKMRTEPQLIELDYLDLIHPDALLEVTPKYEKYLLPLET